MRVLRIKEKKPWYIWFSLFAFAILWGDTSRRIKFFRSDFNDTSGLWGKACANSFKLILISLILPIFLFGVLGNFVLPEMEYDSIFMEIVMTIFFFVLYFLGVYAAYRHHVWRQENISHLITKHSPSKGSDEDEEKPQ